MWLVVVAIVGLVLAYLVLNGKRNSDPLNRKCAAEILDTGSPTASDIAAIFLTNARYRKQANHILSMVPPLLMSAGYSKDKALLVVPLLRQAAAMVPE